MHLSKPLNKTALHPGIRINGECAIAPILPAGTSVAEQIGPLSGELLFKETEILSPRTVLKRLREFAAGRTCARVALRNVGIPLDTEILKGSHGQPLWPEGITGSITHTQYYCCAAVVPLSRVASLGIDAEPNLPLDGGVFELVSTFNERKSISTLSIPGIHVDRLLFSIKESVYKAWFPLEHSFLDFHEVIVEFDQRNPGWFDASIAKMGYTAKRFPPTMRGQYLLNNGTILSSASILPTQ